MAKITNPQKDPMGMALLDYQKGVKGGVIHVSSDIAVNDLIPVDYMYRDQRAMPEWELLALDHCRGKILDIGAGAGSHALILQERGSEVLAMDVSPGAVEAMKCRGLNTIHENIFDFQGLRFDTLLMMMNGIGLVGDIQGLERFLESAHQMLEAGGQILLDSSDLSYLYEDKTILKPDKRYEGIIEFQMRYKNIKGDPFFWIYIEYEKLKSHAQRHGYVCSLIKEGPHFEYLASLTPA
ncbi:MAG: methyltransferase domain-containing protein [Bacteroidia bacterium]|nr:methyltransferase domain-containing protein [Bacteroidia bacterium]